MKGFEGLKNDTIWAPRESYGKITFIGYKYQCTLLQIFATFSHKTCSQLLLCLIMLYQQQCNYG